MSARLRTLPNLLTAARLLLIPTLWILALLKYPLPVGLGLIVAFLTDVLDGWLARWLRQVSEFGSKFDSLVDNLLIPSALVWLWLLRPEVYLDHLTAWLVAITLYFASLLVGIVKFRRFANLHLHSKRYGSVVMYAFVSSALILSRYNLWLFYAAMGMFILSSAEGLLIQITRSQVDEHMGSIIIVWLRRQRGVKPPV